MGDFILFIIISINSISQLTISYFSFCRVSFSKGSLMFLTSSHKSQQKYEMMVDDEMIDDLPTHHKLSVSQLTMSSFSSRMFLILIQCGMLYYTDQSEMVDDE